MCAEHVYLLQSSVIPGHSFVERVDYHYVTAECPIPEWCERTLEHTILAADDVVEVMPDTMLVFDGNSVAQNRREWTLQK
jgi:hypothetical protein